MSMKELYDISVSGYEMHPLVERYLQAERESSAAFGKMRAAAREASRKKEAQAETLRRERRRLYPMTRNRVSNPTRDPRKRAHLEQLLNDEEKLRSLAARLWEVKIAPRAERAAYQAAHIAFLAAKAALEANPDARNNLAAWKTWQ